MDKTPLVKMKTMGKAKKLGLVFIVGAVNVVAGVAIYYYWKPIASWYLNYKPVLGVDFYNLTTYVSYLSRHFVLPFSGWKYIWWNGGPLIIDYPLLHAYLVLPLLNYFSLPQAVKVYMLIWTFLFLFFSYLLFAELSKNRILAAILSVASAFSVGLYGALVWGGSLPYFATQAFLPLTLLYLVKYFNSGNQRMFYLSTLFLGISFYGHPQLGFSYIGPFSFLLLLAYPKEGKKYFSLQKIKRIFIYFLVAGLIAYPQLIVFFGGSPYQMIRAVPTTLTQVVRGLLANTGLATQEPVEGGAPRTLATPEIANFNKAQLGRYVTDTNELFFALLAVSAVVLVASLLIRRKRLRSLKTFVFALPALWVFFYNVLFAYGFNLFQGGWYRAFWAFPLSLGVLISFVWGDFLESIKERFSKVKKKAYFNLTLVSASSVIFLVVGFLFLQKDWVEKVLVQIERPGQRQQSSAFPDSLNVYTQKKEFGNLKERLIPSWLDPDNTQYRLYDADQRVNIWWNAAYDMPLARGYVDLPPGDIATGSYYWTAIALTQSQGTSSLVESWGWPEEIAYNNALFLVDWFSIKYIEAEHEKSDSFNPLNTYLKESDIFENREKVIIPGWVQLYEIPDGESLIWHPDVEEYLTYYEVKDELVSPIAQTTDAPVVGVIGSEDAYKTLLRNLAAVNLNSKRIIPVRLGQFIDNVDSSALKDMDALILYSYDYKNHARSWARLEEYVKKGGRVLIETGSDVKQTDSVNLPAKFSTDLPSIFPLNQTKKEKMDSKWQLSGKGSKETKAIKLKEFGPPVLDGEPWQFSLPSSGGLRQGARVILENQGTPLVVAWGFGEGEVIWSGMNLPFHINTAKSLEEAKFFNNLLNNLIDISAVSSSAGFEVDRVSPNKIVISGSGAGGVLFRENFYPGWKASIESGGKKLRQDIYKTGPTYYGFSFVRIPEELRNSFTVTFSYGGEFWTYFWWVVSFITVIVLIDVIIFNSRFVAPSFTKIARKIGSRISGWWEKEEEY